MTVRCRLPQFGSAGEALARSLVRVIRLGQLLAEAAPQRERVRPRFKGRADRGRSPTPQCPDGTDAGGPAVDATCRHASVRWSATPGTQAKPTGRARTGRPSAARNGADRHGAVRGTRPRQLLASLRDVSLYAGDA